VWPADWQEWSHLSSPASGVPGGAEFQLCQRLIESAGRAETAAIYLRHELPEVASEFAAQYVALVRHAAEWETVAEFGRCPVAHMSFQFFDESRKRNAAGCIQVPAPTGKGSWSICFAPLPGEAFGELLVFCGRGLGQQALPGVLGAAHGLARGLEIVRRHESLGQRIERLRAILPVTPKLIAARETKSLLEMAVAEAARLLTAERSILFTWERGQQELSAWLAAGSHGHTLRLPDTSGIEGECLSTGKAIVVDDAARDTRINREVEAGTGLAIRNLLCVPLVDSRGERIGVFEAINKREGPFIADDQECLTEVGVLAAAALATTREREHLVRQHQQQTAPATQDVELIGESHATAALRSTVGRLAGTDLPVLLQGESGTGKDAVAQLLHHCGTRREHPCVIVDCGALAGASLESELFGCEPEAGVDAGGPRQGKVELADGGTLVLDGIGNLDERSQARLLHLLEHKAFLRVGGSQPIRVNVRIVAATNVSLVAAVREKKFREDLYYRLSVVAVDLPPLRDRPEDILPLADYFLGRFCAQSRRKNVTLAPDSRARLAANGWPGNVRELRNLMERIAFFGPAERVEPAYLALFLGPESARAAAISDLELNAATARFQQEHIRRMIQRAGGNMTAAAGLLGLHRSNLYRKMRQLKMSEARDAEG
jgi:Nif-specific regulatory protein